MRYVHILSIICLSLESGCVAKPPSESTREHMVAGMSMVLKSWDKDGDSKLSHAEVQGMVDEGFRRIAIDASGGKMTADLEKQRQEFLGFYASQDTNRDGNLSLQELLKGPLASFDCMDSNHDNKVSQDEVFIGMRQCPSVNLEDYAPRP